jgi:cation diffusion facilitator family transporter
MVTLLAKIFIKNKDVTDNGVRAKYGVLTGCVGIILNLIISAGKIVAGILTGAISIIADGLNNVSDAGSSIITMIGFKLSNKPIDSQHPFGHGRIEYVSGLIVSMLILVVGAELAINSVKTIITPAEVDISIMSVIILGVSIAVKLYMFSYNYFIGKKINSEALRATALDSISDVMATAAVLVCSLITYYTGVVLDSYAGLLVSCFIIFTGSKSIRGIVNLLIGAAPDPAFIKAIAKTVSAYPIVRGMHDLVIHNYGVGRSMITLHVEVPADCNIMEAHDSIDNIEQELQKKFKCHAVIHMDPVLTDDPYVNQIKTAVKNIILSINPNFSIHDFRMNQGPTHTNLIFDLVITHDTQNTADEIKSLISDKIKELDPSYNCVINIDLPYAQITEEK